MDEILFTQIVMDLTSAIEEKNAYEKRNRYADVLEIGSIAHFLQAIRSDKKRVLSLEQIKAYSSMYGIYKISFLHEIENKYNRKILEKVNSHYEIQIKDFNEICKICYSLWEELLESDLFIQSNQVNLITLIEECLVPQKIDFISNKYDERVVIDAEELSLIQKRGNFFMSPLFFKEIGKTTLDILTEYDIGNQKLIETIRKVNESQGLPVSSLDDSIANLLSDGSYVGILQPIQLDIDGTKRTFVFSNPTKTENSELTYETAAYFRFNEIFASEEFGRLKLLQVYLRKLIDDGIAGDVTNIGRNYRPLELKGVIKVIPGSTSGRYRMELLKRSTVEEAKLILNSDSDNPLATKYKYPPDWIRDSATVRASEIKIKKKASLDLRKLLRDY